MERYTGLCILLDYVTKEILSKDDYLHNEDASLQNTEEWKTNEIMEISWLKSVVKFIKGNIDKKPHKRLVLYGQKYSIQVSGY